MKSRTSGSAVGDHHTFGVIQIKFLDPCDLMDLAFDLVHEAARRLDELDGRGSRAIRHQIGRTREQLRGVAGKLETLSPLGVLGRGYSLTSRSVDGRLRLLSDAALVGAGDEITTRLAKGQIVSRVERTETDG